MIHQKDLEIAQRNQDLIDAQARHEQELEGYKSLATREHPKLAEAKVYFDWCFQSSDE